MPPRRVPAPRARRPPKARLRRRPPQRLSRAALPAGTRPAGTRPAASAPTAAHITARTCEPPCLLGVTLLVGHAGGGRGGARPRLGSTTRRGQAGPRLLMLGGDEHQAPVHDVRRPGDVAGLI